MKYHLAFATLMTLALTACDASSDGASLKPITQPYSKPGAAVSFLSDYDSQSEAGVPEVIKIAITENYDEGVLRVTLIPDQYLTTQGDLTKEFLLNAGSQHDMTITVTPQSKGELYLNVRADVKLADGQMMRANTALIINAGRDLNVSQKTQAKVHDNSIDGVIEMPAKEEIK